MAKKHRRVALLKVLYDKGLLKKDELTKLLLTLIRIRLGEKQIALRENFQIEIIPEKPSENIVVNSYEEF